MLDPAASPDPGRRADAVRQGLADQLHEVFLVAMPLVLVVFVATLAIKSLPLRETATRRAVAEEVGHEVLDAMAQSAPGTTRDDAASRDTGSVDTASADTAPDAALRDRRHVAV